MTNPTHITAQPGVPFVDLVREFDAPPAAVYKAHTDPDLFPRWMLPRGIQLQNMQMDARAGRGWSYAFEGEGNMRMSAFGVFHSVEPRHAGQDHGTKGAPLLPSWRACNHGSVQGSDTSMVSFADRSAENPNLRQQDDEWRDGRAQSGEGPTGLPGLP